MMPAHLLFHSSLLVALVLWRAFFTINAEQGICLTSFDISNRTIIKSRDSLNNGAKFVRAVRATNRKQCEQQCCNINPCNVAVLQEKPDATDVDSNCYLFNCGSLSDFKCVFSIHDDYVSMGLMINREELEKEKPKVHEQFKHALDLNILRTKQEKDEKTSTANNRQGTLRAPPNNPQQMLVDPSSAAGQDDNSGYANAAVDDNLLNGNPYLNSFNYGSQPNGANINSNLLQSQGSTFSNQDPNTPDNYKQMQANTQQQRVDPVVNGNNQPAQQIVAAPALSKPPADVSACSEWQWQCIISKECIAIYDLCTGIAQCRDKTDELDYVCIAHQAQSTPPIVIPPSTTPANIANYQSLQLNGNADNNAAQYQRNYYNNAGQLQQPATKQNNRIRPPPQQPPSLEASNRNALPQQQQRIDGIPQARPPSTSQKQQVLPEVKSESVAKFVQSGLIEPDAIHADQSVHVAVLLLGVGVTLLAVLLVFIACRLRRSPKRSKRKGRLLDTDEGEHLMNGLFA